MQIEQVDLASAATRRACHEVYVAALRADQAEGPWLSAGRFGNWLTAGWVRCKRAAAREKLLSSATARNVSS